MTRGGGESIELNNVNTCNVVVCTCYLQMNVYSKNHTPHCDQYMYSIYTYTYMHTYVNTYTSITKNNLKGISDTKGDMDQYN